MKPKFHSRPHLGLIALSFATAGMSPIISHTAKAGNTWDGDGSAPFNWSDDANWDGNTAPGYGTLVFTGSSGTTNTIDANYSMNQINWNGSSDWTLNNSGGSVLSLFDNGGTQAKIESLGSGGVTINAPITFAATAGAAWGEINAASSSITFGTGTLTVNGSQVAGIRMFGGSGGISTSFNNTVSASGKYFSTSAVGQTINIGGSFTSGDFYLMNTGTLNVNSGATFNASAVRLGGDFATTGTQDLTKGATFNLAATAGGQTYSGTINSVASNTSGALVVNSQNTSNTNTLSGQIALDSNLAINQSSGGTLNITSIHTAADVSNVLGTDIKGFTLTFGGAGNIVVGPSTGGLANIYNSTGNGAVIKSGAGTLTLSGANTYSGGTTISGGVLKIDNAAALNTTNGTIKMTGGTLQYGTGITTDYSGRLTTGTGQSFSIDTNGNNVTFATAITGTGNTFTKLGAGTLTLSSTGNTYSGTTTISAGTISINNNGNIGGAVSLNGGVLKTTNTTALTNTHAITIGSSGGSLDILGTATSGQNSRVITGGSTLLGSGALTINGDGALDGFGGASGVLVVTGANTYSGAITLQNGGILAMEGGTLGSAATITLNNNSELSATNTQSNNIIVNGGTNTALSFTNGASGNFAGTVTLNANLTVAMRNWYSTGAQNGTISGAISGTGGLTVAGGGVVALSGTNNYGGGTSITAGNAQFTKLVAMPASGAVAVGTGSTLAVNLGGTGEWTTGTSGNGTVGGLLAGLGGQSGGTVTWTGAVNLGLDTTNAGGTQTYSGNIANVGTSLGVTKLGVGTLLLSGANTHTGATTVNAGTLTLSGSIGATGTAAGQVSVGQAGNSSNAILNVQTGSTLKLNNANMLVGNGTTTAGQGFVFQSGGAVSGINQLTIGTGTNSYGYYNLSSGTLGLNELDAGGFNAGSAGVLDMSGGTMNVANWLILGRGGNGSSGVLNMTGGTLNYSGGNEFSINWGQGTTGNQRSVVNIANASLISANATNVNLMRNGQATNLGEINLLSGGLLQANGIAPGSATGNSILNFNGGTLKAFSANTTFLTTNLTAANVYSGGGTIDNNGVAITLLKGLLAPAGSGANSNPTVTNGGSGYVGAPLVTVSGAGGTGAAAYATVAGGVVTGIVVTNPGTGYTGALSFTLTGGGGTGATVGNVTQTANTSGTMTFQGSGTTTLTTASTYTGNTSISMGKTTGLNSASKLNLSFAANQTDILNNTSNSSALILGGSLASDATTVLGGGQLTLTGVATSTNTQRFNGMTVGTGGNNIVFANNATANTIALNVGAISRIAGGTLHITQPTGTVSTSNGVQTATGTASTILTDANGTAYATVGGTAAAAGDWAAKDATNAFIVGGSTLGGFYAAANSTATFTAVGATGNADITGNLTATAGTNVGSLRMNGATLNLNLGGGTTTIGTGGVLFGSSTAQTISNGTIRAGAGKELVFINTHTGAPQINSVIADSTSGQSSVTYRALQLTQSNGQFSIGSAGNTYTGNTYIESGRVATVVSTAFGSGAGADVYINGNTNGQAYLSTGTFANHFYIVGNGWNESTGVFGAIRLQSGTLSGQVTLLGNATIGAQGGTGTFSGVIDDGGAGYGLTFNGGTSILTNAETYTGTTTITSGSTLQLGNTTTTGKLSTSSNISIASTGTLAINRSNAVAQGTDFGTITGTTGILTQLGTGALTLTGSNSITTLNVNNATGTVDIGSGNLTINNGGGNTIQSSTGGTITGGTITLGATDGDTGTASGTTLTINSKITSGAGVRLEYWNGATGNTGTLVLTNAANDYTGGTVINTAGTISVSTINNTGISGNLGTGGTITLATNLATLKYTGAGETTNRTITMGGGANTGGRIDASGSGTALKLSSVTNTNTANGTATLTLTGSGLGEITGAVANQSGTRLTALTKAGLGTWTLTGTNSYTGATTVSAGTLVVNGSISTGTLTTVGNTGTLGGSGTVGALTVLFGGTVAPGNSPGILSAGNTNLEAGSTLGIEINGTTVGTDYDQLNVTGTVSLAGALSVDLGYTPVNGALFFILANDDTDAITGTFSNASTNGGTYIFDGQDFQISYFGDSVGNTFTGGNDVVLMAIPEPRAALLGGLGMLALLRRRRH